MSVFGLSWFTVAWSWCSFQCPWHSPNDQSICKWLGEWPLWYFQVIHIQKQGKKATLLSSSFDLEMLHDVSARWFVHQNFWPKVVHSRTGSRCCSTPPSSSPGRHKGTWTPRHFLVKKTVDLHPEVVVPFCCCFSENKPGVKTKKERFQNAPSLQRKDMPIRWSIKLQRDISWCSRTPEPSLSKCLKAAVILRAKAPLSPRRWKPQKIGRKSAPFLIFSDGAIDPVHQNAGLLATKKTWQNGNLARTASYFLSANDWLHCCT